MKPLFLLLIWFTLNNLLYAQVDPVDSNGLGIGGYDVVAYFTEGKAIQGSSKFTSEYRGIKYYFSSSENQMIFEKNPDAYLPQFDGYCALAVSYGKKISIDPKTFRISNQKLYLFYHGKAGSKTVNSLDTWVKDETRLLKKANDLWPDVKKKKYKPEDKL
jgi:YHS domain-containing protein